MKRKKPEVQGRESPPKHAKVVLAAVGYELRERGIEIPEVREIFENAGYSVGQRTLERWLSVSKAGQPIYIGKETRGRKALLSPLQTKILIGFVLTENDLGKKVSRTHCKKFLRKAFCLDISLQSISRYLNAGGLSYRLMGSRELRNIQSYDDYVNLYVSWILRVHNTPFFLCDRDKLASIDFMSNSRRTEREKTYSPRGGKQQKKTGPTAKYTDCYSTLLWADGINRTQALLFTHNPDLNPAGSNGKAVREICKRLKISLSRIYYTKSKKDYYAEDSDMVYTILQKYNESVAWEKVHILRDAGRIYTKKGEYIFVDGWSESVCVYQPICHGELSPNGNSFHATVKNKWREGRDQYETEAEQALYLLSLCDPVAPQQIRDQFDRNLRLNSQGRTFKEIEEMLKPRRSIQKKTLRWWIRARAAFHIWKAEN